VCLSVTCLDAVVIRFHSDWIRGWVVGLYSTDDRNISTGNRTLIFSSSSLVAVLTKHGSKPFTTFSALLTLRRGYRHFALIWFPGQQQQPSLSLLVMALLAHTAAIEPPRATGTSLTSRDAFKQAESEVQCGRWSYVNAASRRWCYCVASAEMFREQRLSVSIKSHDQWMSCTESFNWFILLYTFCCCFYCSYSSSCLKIRPSDLLAFNWMLVIFLFSRTLLNDAVSSWVI
jgi:hypothetical protein